MEAVEVQFMLFPFFCPILFRVIGQIAVGDCQSVGAWCWVLHMSWCGGFLYLHAGLCRLRFSALETLIFVSLVQYANESRLPDPL